MSRRLEAPVIAGNWKLNHGPADAAAFFQAFLPVETDNRPGSLLFFPPTVSLASAREATADSPIVLGVQNIYWEVSGAFTGEISAALARAAGAEVILVGHSERRHIFGETDEDTARKLRSGLDEGLSVMLCVGELIEEREAGDAFAVVERQLAAGLASVGAEELDRVLVAYEPVWAIGTGKTATVDDASSMHAHISGLLQDAFGPRGESVPILYGGSVKPDNAAELLADSHIDGVLVGGASLEAISFRQIWEARP